MSGFHQKNAYILVQLICVLLSFLWYYLVPEEVGEYLEVALALICVGLLLPLSQADHQVASVVLGFSALLERYKYALMYIFSALLSILFITVFPLFGALIISLLVSIHIARVEFCEWRVAPLFYYLLITSRTLLVWGVFVLLQLDTLILSFPFIQASWPAIVDLFVMHKNMWMILLAVQQLIVFVVLTLSGMLPKRYLIIEISGIGSLILMGLNLPITVAYALYFIFWQYSAIRDLARSLIRYYKKDVVSERLQKSNKSLVWIVWSIAILWLFLLYANDLSTAFSWKNYPMILFCGLIIPHSLVTYLGIQKMKNL